MSLAFGCIVNPPLWQAHVACFRILVANNWRLSTSYISEWASSLQKWDTGWYWQTNIHQLWAPWYSRSTSACPEDKYSKVLCLSEKVAHDWIWVGDHYAWSERRVTENKCARECPYTAETNFVENSGVRTLFTAPFQRDTTMDKTMLLVLLYYFLLACCCV